MTETPARADDNTTWLHRLPPGVKVVALVVVGSVIFLIDDWRPLAGALVAVCAGYAAARIGWRETMRCIRPVVWLAILFFPVQWIVAGPLAGVVAVLRLAVVVLFASLVTETTAVSDLLASLERLCRPLAVFGVNPAKVGLALSMTLRFIPLIAEVTGEVREAQRVRGLDRSVLALAVPVILRMLKMADEISDAIEARSPDADARPRDGA